MHPHVSTMVAVIVTYTYTHTKDFQVVLVMGKWHDNEEREGDTVASSGMMMRRKRAAKTCFPAAVCVVCV